VLQVGRLDWPIPQSERHRSEGGLEGKAKVSMVAVIQKEVSIVFVASHAANTIPIAPTMSSSEWIKCSCEHAMCLSCHDCLARWTGHTQLKPITRRRGDGAVVRCKYKRNLLRESRRGAMISRPSREGKDGCAVINQINTCRMMMMMMGIADREPGR